MALICFGVLEYRISKQVELDTEIRLGKEAFGYLERDLERMNKISEADSKEVDDKKHEEEQKQTSNNKIASSASERYQNLLHRIDNIDKEIMALRHKSERAENHFQRTIGIRPIMLFGGFFGIALAFAGFYFWYFKLQKYQDLLLRNQAIQAAQQIAQADADNSAA